jgi:hypothetical protein
MVQAGIGVADTLFEVSGGVAVMAGTVGVAAIAVVALSVVLPVDIQE